MADRPWAETSMVENVDHRSPALGKMHLEVPKTLREKWRIARAGRNAKVFEEPNESFKDAYILGKELGRGHWGVAYECTERATGRAYACKIIAKKKLVTRQDLEDVRKEVQIMQHLAGHLNIVRFKAAYEDSHDVLIVMELCTGGELFDRIILKGHFSERAAADVTRLIVGVIQYCHQSRVMHRDIKPENFLLADPSENADLKMTDFGLSVFFTKDQLFTEFVGSAYYVAPEVLQECYGPEADIWSAGVILYILLCGIPPFNAVTDQEIYREILGGEIDFHREPWPHISSSAKDLVRQMLTRNPRRRFTAQQILAHPWIAQQGVASDLCLASIVLPRLRQFTAANKLKKAALRVIAETMSPEEIRGLSVMFQALDTDHSGTITFQELNAGLQKAGSGLAVSEVRAIMDAADLDHNGTIDYNEFIAATMHLSALEKEDRIFTAFQFFDKDHSGTITTRELQEALYQNGMAVPGDHSIEDIIQEVDSDKDGVIDYHEFQEMMRKDLGGGRSRIGMRRPTAIAAVSGALRASS